MGKKTLDIHYTFTFPDGVVQKFEVQLDAESVEQVNQPLSSTSEWTRLEFQQCHVCPLSKESTPHCPVALSLERLVNAFRDVVSYKDVHVTVEAEGRLTTKQTAMQGALQSIFGILMATSGCPPLKKLKPMARFHLPFSSMEETIYRVVTMYMAAQYFRRKAGKPVDFDFENLKTMYEKIHRVNKDFTERLRAASEQDAHLNSMVTLDSFALMIPYYVNKELKTLKGIFAPYLEDDLPEGG